jgi:hypothetical protein
MKIIIIVKLLPPNAIAIFPVIIMVNAPKTEGQNFNQKILPPKNELCMQVMKEREVLP